MKKLTRIMVLVLLICGFVTVASHQASQVNAQNAKTPITAPVTAAIKGFITFYQTDRKPVYNVEIKFVNSNNQVIQTTRTDKNGYYNAPVSSGTYTVIPQTTSTITTFSPASRVVNTADKNMYTNFEAIQSK